MFSRDISLFCTRVSRFFINNRKHEWLDKLGTSLDMSRNYLSVCKHEQGFQGRIRLTDLLKRFVTQGSGPLCSQSLTSVRSLDQSGART